MKDVYRMLFPKTLGIAAVVAVMAMFAMPAQAQQCQFHMDLYDSFGDGWNGGSLTVKVNNVNVLTNVTLGSGSGPVRYSFLADVNDVITTVFTPGGWPEECYYRLRDGNDNIILTSGPVSGGPPNINYTVVQSACVAPPVVSGCTYTIRMWDSYGDGWNGCYLQVYIDGVLEHNNITISSGSGPVDYTFNVENGQEIKLTFVIGSWEEECSFRVYDPRNNEIYSDGLNNTVPKAKNTVIGYGACTFDIMMVDAVLGYAEDHWARREMPDLNIVHATVADLEHSRPPYLKAVYKLGSMPVDSTDGVAEAFDVKWVDSLANLTFQQGITGLMPGPSPNLYVRVFVPEDLDLDNSNDGAMCQTVEVFDYKVKGFEDFATWTSPNLGISEMNNMGWTTADLDGGEVWQSTDIVGPVLLFHPGPATDDWLFMPAAMLDAAASYRLDGEIFASASNTTIELAYGMAANPSAMTVFATLSNITINSPTQFGPLTTGYAPYFNTPPVAGNYYIGIHIRSGGVAMSWLKLDENPSPPPKIGYGYPGADISEFEDGQGAAINLMAVYKQPGKINKTFEVATTTDIYGINGDFLWDVETDTPWITLTKETPDQTLQGWNFTPERPRQFQTFTMSINPAGLAPGLHTGTLRFYGTLFNDDFPPPDQGLVATNEIYEVTVNLRVVTTGTKNGPKSMEATMGPLVPGPIYNFVDPNTQTPIATVEVTGGSIDQLLIRVFPNQLPNNIARKMYVMRYWQLEHTSGGPWTANVTFPYADQEAAMVFDRLQLRGIRQDPVNGPWEDPIMGTTSVSDPANNSVTVNDLNEMNSLGNIALAHPYTIIVKDSRGLPETFGMKQNYPNPFNPNTTISYDVAEERHVRIAVYNSLGSEVAVLVDGLHAAGRYMARVEASALATDTYIYRMTSGDFVQTRRMTLSK